VRNCATKKVRTGSFGFYLLQLEHRESVTKLMGINHRKYIGNGKEGRL